MSALRPEIFKLHAITTCKTIPHKNRNPFFSLDKWKRMVPWIQNERYSMLFYRRQNVLFTKCLCSLKMLSLALHCCAVLLQDHWWSCCTVFWILLSIAYHMRRKKPWQISYWCHDHWFRFFWQKKNTNETVDTFHIPLAVDPNIWHSKIWNCTRVWIRLGYSYW